MNRRGLHGGPGAHGTVAQVINAIYEYEKMGKDIKPLMRELYETALNRIV